MIGGAIFGGIAGCVIAIAGCSITEEPLKTVGLLFVLVVAHIATQGV